MGKTNQKKPPLGVSKNAKQSKPANKPSFFATVKNDFKQASNFNKLIFGLSALAFVAGIVLFAVSCKILGPIPALIGFALILVGAVIGTLIAYKNHSEVNKPKGNILTNTAQNIQRAFTFS